MELAEYLPENAVKFDIFSASVENINELR